jgi:hypothetical protein
MTDRGAHVVEEALSLPLDEQIEVAERLVSHISEASQRRIDRLWVEEARDRLAAFERGEMGAVTMEEAFAAARKKITR